MSYLDKLKNNVNQNTIKEEKAKIKPGWIILNKEKYLKNIKNKNMDFNNISFENKEYNSIVDQNKTTTTETNENKEIVYTKRDYHEEFYIKYGSLLLDFFMDMKDNFENNCYNILDNKEKGLTCFSYDFELFVMKHTKMIKPENTDDNSNMSDEEDEDYRF